MLKQPRDRSQGFPGPALKDGMWESWWAEKINCCVLYLKGLWVSEIEYWKCIYLTGLEQFPSAAKVSTRDARKKCPRAFCLSARGS